MKFFLDTEFTERGPEYPIKLLSIGIVAEDGTSFYAINKDCKRDECNEWVQQKVWPHLHDASSTYGTFFGSPPRIGDAVRQFVDSRLIRAADERQPSFWGYYCDYDWVVFCQLFGAMMDLPKGWPRYCRDIKQWVDALGNPKLPEQITKEHHALNDAEWIRECYAWLATIRTDPTRLPMLPECPRLTEGW